MHIYISGRKRLFQSLEGKNPITARAYRRIISVKQQET